MKNTIASLILFLIITSVSAQNTEHYLVASKTLNMRSGAGTQHAVVATLAQEDAVTLIKKQDNGWWLVDFNENTGYVSSQFLKKDPYGDWEKKNYQSGVTPDCENVVPQFDHSIDNYLRINVGSNTDVVVKLMKKDGIEEECIRIVYVRSGEIYDIKNVPEGKYYLKIAYGRDLRQKIVDDQCIVKFIIHPNYKKGDKILDFNKIKQPDTTVGGSRYENWSIPSFEVSLDIQVIPGTKASFTSNSISEAEFNK